MSSLPYPLPPRVRVRVGVSGHRGPPKLPIEFEAPVRASIARILALVAEEGRKADSAYLACAPARAKAASPTGDGGQFVVVSSLAEGADRLVADAGIDASFALEVVLPFGRDEYERDFETPNSRSAYRSLLHRATAVFELNGQPADRPAAYEAAGLVMLANADLLIVIWDGHAAAGIGGTAQIVSGAVADRIPVFWIEPANPTAVRVSWSPTGEISPAHAYTRPTESFRLADDAELARAIAQVLTLPTQAEAQRSLKGYLSSKERRWNLCPWYSLLSWLFAGRPIRRSDFYLPPAIADTAEKWSDYLAMLPTDRAQRPAIERILLPACAVADHLATYYSLVYRSTYVFNFLFSALAVGLALSGVFIHQPTVKSYFVGAELAVIVVILVTWLYGHRRQWHRRWLECRRLAECLRHLRIFAPLAAAGPLDRPGADGGDEEDWVSWYAWSLRRRLPLPDRAVDGEYLDKLRTAVRIAELSGQISYHERNAERMYQLDHRIHLSGQWLFVATAGICIIFLCLVWSGVLRDSAEPGGSLLLSISTFFTALLPTLGAALAAIHAQGQFNTSADQSALTAKRLTAIDKILAEQEPVFARLADRVEEIADVMMSDLIEWHTIFRTRPLSLPA